MSDAFIDYSTIKSNFDINTSLLINDLIGKNGKLYSKDEHNIISQYFDKFCDLNLNVKINRFDSTDTDIRNKSVNAITNLFSEFSAIKDLTPGTIVNELISAKKPGGSLTDFSNLKNSLYREPTFMPSEDKYTALAEDCFQVARMNQKDKVLHHLENYATDDPEHNDKIIVKWLDHQKVLCRFSNNNQMAILKELGDSINECKVIGFEDYVRDKLATESGEKISPTTDKRINIYLPVKYKINGVEKTNYDIKPILPDVWTDAKNKGAYSYMDAYNYDIRKDTENILDRVINRTSGDFRIYYRLLDGFNNNFADSTFIKAMDGSRHQVCLVADKNSNAYSFLCDTFKCIGKILILDNYKKLNQVPSEDKFKAEVEAFKYTMLKQVNLPGCVKIGSGKWLKNKDDVLSFMKNVQSSVAKTSHSIYIENLLCESVKRTYNVDLKVRNFTRRKISR